MREHYAQLYNIVQMSRNNAVTHIWCGHSSQADKNG